MMKFTVAFLSLLSALPSLVHSLADQVGTTIDKAYNEQDLEDIAVDEDGTWRQLLVEHDETDFIVLHFKSMHIADSCALYTKGSNKELVVQKFDAESKYNDMEGFWAWSVESTTVSLTLGCATVSDADNAKFSIDKYAVQADPPSVLSICGPDDKVNAVCYKNDANHAEMYSKSKAACRVRINGVGSCTGWLVGVSSAGRSLLLTNEHCIGSQSDAINSSFQFMAENTNCSGPTSGNNNGDGYGGKSLVRVNAGLDYALVELEPNSLGIHAHESYGYFEIENRLPVVGEKIYIPQHAGGRMKQLGIVDTNSTPEKVCKVKSINQNGCTSGQNVDFRYTCDTEGGSSGSPVVLYESNKIIGLHHCGGACNGNMGVMINNIMNEISGYLTLEAQSSAEFWKALFITHK